MSPTTPRPTSGTATTGKATKAPGRPDGTGGHTTGVSGCPGRRSSTSSTRARKDTSWSTCMPRRSSRAAHRTAPTLTGARRSCDGDSYVFHDLETKEIHRRRYVRATGLINGALYRPRRGRHRLRGGRHRYPQIPLPVRVRTLADNIDGDKWIYTGLVVLTGSGGVFSVTGVLMTRFSDDKKFGFLATMTGIFFFILAAAALGFCYWNPSPAEPAVVTLDRTGRHAARDGAAR